MHMCFTRHWLACCASVRAAKQIVPHPQVQAQASIGTTTATANNNNNNSSSSSSSTFAPSSADASAQTPTTPPHIAALASQLQRGDEGEQQTHVQTRAPSDGDSGDGGGGDVVAMKDGQRLFPQGLEDVNEQQIDLRDTNRFVLFLFCLCYVLAFVFLPVSLCMSVCPNAHHTDLTSAVV